ncbi:MAG: diacylglycerol kinase family protein [Planctomycetaceae bacterium]
MAESRPLLEGLPRTLRRPAWRQRLIQAERGLAWGLRADSVFFVHFFGIALVISAGLAFGLALWQWVAIVLALTVVLSAEMFQQALKLLAGLSTAADGAGHSPSIAARALSIGTAAVLVACLGSTLVLALIFIQRGCELFGQ